ncbi:DUF1801 domain-containing protein [Herbiconiux sp. VKM Ac-2851]|uniref:DUF1801 domain-containing protein n=1 Tax=Herbiconiux sp. VKM Ac-2851 TaxID=2739025 RepID=UPI0015667CE1|nr:DUF1801 domain-containing protein [Herbiconiux sp. VKM Ac-2851]NQX36934.1 DUF1801 domain-containing protein [Herbiconiux sp. VKM Ac-2851]
MKTIEEFIAALDPGQREQVVELRRVILALPVELDEHIKWNSPSYVHDGIDRITMNVRNKAGAVQLVLHFDTARAEVRNAPPVMVDETGLFDETGLVRWLSDIRGVITVPPGTAVSVLEPGLSSALEGWLRIR